MTATPLSIDGATQLLGLIGNPVAHSLSPAMHNAALARMGVNAVYLPLPVATEGVGAALAGLAAIGVRGINVTIPHKQTAMPFLQEVSARAQQVGAVNTIYPLSGGGWGGTNTDVSGFLYPLQQLDRPWSASTAIVLGSGGAARAAIQGCFELGFARVVAVGRSRDRLLSLTRTWSQLQTATWDELAALLPETLLIANATPIGMQSESDPAEIASTPLSLEHLARLPREAIVYDLVYIPKPTALLKYAAARELVAIDGLEMLVQQGAIALSLWLGGREVPVEVMRRAALAHLGLD
ncbi:shikimate dehydrogenase [Synechococcus sp. PCC 7336]|uniref:shikimate dehydrogenase n=1 Tax=Synechococcus sp. PCC 7336 TaxID=195250 RepID=UPI000345BCCA|nr:shikimate dehydrogenase [Synechococcus sp. PCC 7336]